MSKPILLLDVDGVLNAFGEDKPALEEVWMHGPYVISQPEGTRLRVAELSEVFDIVWTTAWEEQAPEEWPAHLGGLGADWPYIAWRWPYDVRGTWKLPDVVAWAESHAKGRPLAWLDDDLWNDARAWAATRNELRAPTLLVTTIPHLGMTATDHAELMAFGRRELVKS